MDKDGLAVLLLGTLAITGILMCYIILPAAIGGTYQEREYVTGETDEPEVSSRIAIYNFIDWDGDPAISYYEVKTYKFNIDGQPCKYTREAMKSHIPYSTNYVHWDFPENTWVNCSGRFDENRTLFTVSEFVYIREG